MKKFIFVCISVFLSICVYSQKDTTVKNFGVVTADDFKPSELEQFGNPKAVVLINQRINTFNTYDHQVMFFNTHHIRYKALEDNFLENNQIVVPFSGRYEYEKVLNTRARIYRLVNQKVTEHKVKYKNVEVIDRDSIKSSLIIHFPEIKAGDIVDIQYTKVTFDYSHPEVWDFHSAYPCKVSQVVTEFPDFIEYEFLVTGENAPVDRLSDYHFVSINENFSSANGPVNVYSERGQMITFRFPSVRNVFTAYNTVPVDTIYQFMPQKKYFDSRLIMRPKKITEDIHQNQSLTDVWARLTRLLFAYDEPGNRYLSKFEVWNQIVSPGYIKFESNNWTRFTKDLRRSSVFWKPILKSFVLNDTLSEIFDNADGVDSLSLLKKLYGYVSSNIKWDGTYSNCVYHAPETVLKSRKGSSAEINATLISLLRRAGFDAYPVLSATRDFGSVDSSYVNKLQFNNILAYVSFIHDNNILSYIIDATDPNRPFDQLNKQNINNQYLVMLTEDHYFVSLQQSFADELYLTANLSDGMCRISDQSNGVFTEEKHVSDTSFAIGGNNLKSIFQVLMGNNPFPELTRSMPVDFVVPRHYTYKVECNQPMSNGFAPQNFSAVGGRLNATFGVSEEGGHTVYQIDVDISSPFFELSVYGELREFFTKVYAAAE